MGVKSAGSVEPRVLLRRAGTVALATRYPELAREWHPTKNGALTPATVASRAARKVYWRCSQDPGHVWQASVVARAESFEAQGSAMCPRCRPRPRGPSLVQRAPRLAKEWHPTKNGALRAADFGPQSERVVWWKCPRGADHEWQAKILSRAQATSPTSKSGCPRCLPGRIAKGSVQRLRPALAAEWHPTKNRLRADEVTPKSQRRIWWKCPKGPDHEWATSVQNRTLGTGCPFCSGRKASKTSSLATRHPALAKMFDAAKNGGADPSRIPPGTTQAYFWRCEHGHSFHLSLYKLVLRKEPCGECRRLRIEESKRPHPRKLKMIADYPEVMRFWHSRKNAGVRPETVRIAAAQRFWWSCPKARDHEWQDLPRNRLHPGCPFCSHRRTARSDSLAVRAPWLMKEWDAERNTGIDPYAVLPTAKLRVHFRCARAPDHRWETRLDIRYFIRSKCPFCSGKVASSSHNLARSRPLVAALWHPTKNGGVTAADVTPGADSQAWWRCPRGHEWRQRVMVVARNRSKRSRGCPYCAGKKVARDTSLSTRFPRVAAYWHPRKNLGLTPGDVVPNTNRHVFWRCSKGPDHEWEERVSRVVKKKELCPFCANTRASVTNSLAAVAPAFARQLDRELNDFGPTEVTAGSTARVWWSCDKGKDHVWQTTIAGRVTNRTGCPFCLNRRLSVTNSLHTRSPRLTRDFHPTRNGKLTPKQIMYRSAKRIWWHCALGHVWLQSPHDRSKGSGCPACARQRKRKVVTVADRYRH